MDENNPIGAVCLEHGVVPEGHKGPLHDPPTKRVVDYSRLGQMSAEG